jgi:hypothetical protein
MTARNRLSPATLLTSALLIPIAMFALVKFGDPLFDAMGSGGKVFALAVSVLGTGTAVVLTVLHWKRLDEPAREAHKWAWFWGGSIGFALGAIGASLVFAIPGLGVWLEQTASTAAQRSHGKFPATSFAVFFGIGAVAVVTLVCHVSAWLYWWSKRRAA